MPEILEISLLGEFQVKLDGEPIDTLTADRPRSLFVYLLLHRHAPQSRQHIAFTLWMDSDEGQARGNLRNLIYSLRQSLPESDTYLIIDTSTIQWNTSSPYTLDVEAFQDAIQQARDTSDLATRQVALEKAVSLYQGELLPATYDEWVIPLREELRQDYLEALSALIHLLEDSTDYRAAIRYAQRIVQQDPLHESSYATLMRLHGKNGDRAGVRRVYDLCASTLDRELGVEPSPNTQKAYEEALRIDAHDHQSQDKTVAVSPESLPQRHFSFASRPPPLPVSPLIGRDEEMTHIAQLLANPECRLLTLAGLGGIGKTRLALEIATAHRRAFEHGVGFVSVSAIENREQLVTAIADSLGIVLYNAGDRSLQLIQYLQDKEILLTLDSFEHLLNDEGSVQLISDLLQGMPHLKLLVTSREHLQIRSEWLFEIHGLSLPEKPQSDDLESSAVSLFIQRAQQVKSDFTPKEDELQAIIRICELVEGLPLGIELAAAWVNSVSCTEIAREIELRLGALEHTARDIPDRHRSLTAVFDHSWQLLVEDEQDTLRRLSVFRGGFSREAAEEVVGATLTQLSGLVTKSLIRRSQQGRYDIHEVIRQNAFGYLQEREPEYIATRDRHCAYYMTLLEQRGPELKGHSRTTIVSELIAELANLRSAWEWASSNANSEMISRGADTLFWLYESRSNCREGVPLFGIAVNNLQPEADHNNMSSLAVAQTLSYQGFFYFRQGQHPQGRQLLQRSLNTLDSLSDHLSDAQPALSITQAFLGTVLFSMGDYTEGQALLEESLQTARAAEDWWGVAFCLRQLGHLAHAAGNLEHAHDYFTECLSISRLLDNNWAIATALNALSSVSIAEGTYEEANTLLQEALAIGTKIEDRYNIAFALSGLGRASQAQGQLDEACAYLQESIHIWNEIGVLDELARAMNSLGIVYRLLNQPDKAQKSFREAILIANKLETPPIMLEAVVGMAELLKTMDPERACSLAYMVVQHPAVTIQTAQRANDLHIECERHDLLANITQSTTVELSDFIKALLVD